MFLKHFQLRAEPFAVAPDPYFFYPGHDHREALATLYYVILQRRGCGLMSAGSGMGKTLVLNCLREQIAGFADVIFLRGQMSGGELIESVAGSLGMSEAEGRYWQLRAIERVLNQRAQRGRRTVLMIDGAEQLNGDGLEALEALIALETREGNLLDVLLSGQPRLVNALAAPQFERLRQNIDVSCRLLPLNDKAAAGYLTHRMKQAGSPANLFTPQAAGLLAAAACGIPRRINKLAHQTLAEAWSREAACVDENIVWSVLYDLPVHDLADWGHELSTSSSKDLTVVHHA